MRFRPPSPRVWGLRPLTRKARVLCPRLLSQVTAPQGLHSRRPGSAGLGASLRLRGPAGLGRLDGSRTSPRRGRPSPSVSPRPRADPLRATSREVGQDADAGSPSPVTGFTAVPRSLTLTSEGQTYCRWGRLRFRRVSCHLLTVTASPGRRQVRLRPMGSASRCGSRTHHWSDTEPWAAGHPPALCSDFVAASDLHGLC